MTTGELVSLFPTISPLIVLLVFMIQQSRRDSKDVSVAWVGIAPELFEGFREDIRVSRENAEKSRQEAEKAREELYRLRDEFHQYRVESETKIIGLTKQLAKYRSEVSDVLAEGMDNG